MELKDFAGLGGFPVVVGVVQIVKSTFPNAANWVTVVIALLTSEVWAAAVAAVLQQEIEIALLIGVIVWLMSMGAWSGSKSLIGK